MTPTEAKQCRHTLGLTQTELARLLRLKDAKGNGHRTVRNWEKGVHPVTGPVSLILDMLCNDFDPMAEFCEDDWGPA